jgi:DNA-binding response OmpR family regulator
VAQDVHLGQSKVGDRNAAGNVRAGRNAMRPQAKPNVTVGVVDPDRDSYDRLLSAIAPSTAVFRFYSTGREVLRLRGGEGVAFWLLGVELPDMSGLDLLEMLRDRLDGTATCMVGAEYRIEDEIAAYRAGATLYACKPIEASWLRECLFGRRRVGRGEVLHAIRAGSAARSPPARRRA